MQFLQRDTMITIAPNIPDSEKVEKYRWSMHLSLPYPFPSKKCPRVEPMIGGEEYVVEIHNHYDRIVIQLGDAQNPKYFKVVLHDRRHPFPQLPDGTKFHLEQLQSTIIFTQLKEFPSSKEAFENAGEKVKSCFEFMNKYISACQRNAPLLSTWLLYPVSFYDVSTVYHDVSGYCKEHQQWHHLATGVSMSPARQLQHPAVYIDLPESIESSSFVDMTSELLAEASMSLSRGITRMCLLNSYTAIELFVNRIYSERMKSKYVAYGMPQEEAEKVVENERERNRTNPRFLFHDGLKDAIGLSLLDQEKAIYDELISHQKLRHQVAHTGYKPSKEESLSAHKLCCQAFQKIAKGAGLQSPPLEPDNQNTVFGFSTMIQDVNAKMQKGDIILDAVANSILSRKKETEIANKGSA